MKLHILIRDCGLGIDANALSQSFINHGFVVNVDVEELHEPTNRNDHYLVGLNLIESAETLNRLYEKRKTTDAKTWIDYYIPYTHVPYRGRSDLSLLVDPQLTQFLIAQHLLKWLYNNVGVPK